jgi:hypothetical protein
VKISDLPDGPVRSALLERVPEHQHEWEFAPTDLFDEWLQWEGIIGYTNSIKAAHNLFFKTVWLVEFVRRDYVTLPLGLFYNEDDARNFVSTHDEPQNCNVSEIEIK